MSWVSPKKYCERKGIKLRAFQYRKKKGLIQWRYGGSGRGGEAGKHIEVWIDPDGVQSQTPQGKNRYKIHRGEPGCRVVTPLVNGEPIINIDSNIDSEKNGTAPILRLRQTQAVNGDSPKAVLLSSSSPKPCEVHPPSASQGVFLPMILGDSPESTPLRGRNSGTVPIRSPKVEEIGYLRMALLKAWREKISENGKPKGQTTKDFLECYNSGHLFPNIYDKVDKISRATLYNWDLAERLGGVPALIPQYHVPEPGLVTDYEKYILLNTLLHQNRLKIGTAIKFTKTFLTYKKIESPSSESKLRRFADDFRKTHYPAWVSAREGAKAQNDKCLPYAERDWRLLTVGEGLVADGHRLNFQVINPFTGKPCRATIVLFWDWKSAYVLGWEIMIEENIQCIASALRNAILILGKIPKWLLIDNGKAFKAKCFTSEIELEDGILYGMFATLGIHAHFSQAYNPQEKPLERFWGTFNNWFERLWDSYSGNSIEDKPAWMRRNEKEAQARHGKKPVPRIEDVQVALGKWINFYAGQPSRGRDGMKPGEIFEAEKGPGVDPAELYHLMMVKEKMQVHRNGVTFNGWHYYDEALSNIKDYVIGKYSLSDYSQIYCFYKREFLCIAKPIEPVHPMACESEFPKDQEAHKRVGAQKSRIRHTAKNLIALVETGGCGDLERSFQRSPDVAEVVKVIEDKRKPKKMVSLSTQEEIDNFEIQADKEGPLQFDSFSERYEFLLKKDSLTDSEKIWIHQFETGEIAPGEWELIYGKGGEDAPQVHCDQKRQKVCIGG